MVMKKLKVGFKGDKLNIKAKELSYLGMFRGLMFRNSNCDNLLFNKKGKWAIHSLFVFFSFLALWLNTKNKVVDWKIVKPFCFNIRPRRKFSKLIEIPLNFKNREILNAFIDEEKHLNR
ncbi:MAG: hypothetical protein QXD13_02540 [Candidatus Pacearchaeota archaeon]